MKKYYYYLFGLIALIISFIFDKQIISFIVANRLEFLNKFFILLDYINGFVIFIISLAILYFNKDKKRIPYLILAFLFYAVIVFFLKEFIARPRPYTFGIYALIPDTNFSFPSGHTTAIFTALPFMKKFKNIYYIYIIFAILIAFSRIYLGVHYLSDVIAGILLGLLISNFILKKGKIW